MGLVSSSNYTTLSPTKCPACLKELPESLHWDLLSGHILEDIKKVNQKYDTHRLHNGPLGYWTTLRGGAWGGPYC